MGGNGGPQSHDPNPFINQITSVAFSDGTQGLTCRNTLLITDEVINQKATVSEKSISPFTWLESTVFKSPKAPGHWVYRDVKPSLSWVGWGGVEALAPMRRSGLPTVLTVSHILEAIPEEGCHGAQLGPPLMTATKDEQLPPGQRGVVQGPWGKLSVRPCTGAAGLGKP